MLNRGLMLLLSFLLKWLQERHGQFSLQTLEVLLSVGARPWIQT